MHTDLNIWHTNLFNLQDTSQDAFLHFNEQLEVLSKNPLRRTELNTTILQRTTLIHMDEGGLDQNIAQPLLLINVHIFIS